jgi:hypothetical protein
MIADEAGFKKAKRELDKIQFDIDNATRLEELGNKKEARALKEKAADRAMQLNHYLTQAKTSQLTSEAQERSSRYSADKRLEGDKLQAGAVGTSNKLRSEELSEARTYNAINTAREHYRHTVEGIDRDKTKGQYAKDASFVAGVGSAKNLAPETQARVDEAKLRIANADKVYNKREKDAATAVDTAVGRYQRKDPNAPAAATNKGISKAEFDKLPSGARFTAPDGSIRTKP